MICCRIGVILASHNSTHERACANTERGRFCSDPPKFVEAKSFFVHKEYDHDQHMNDIALIQLKEKITFTGITLTYDLGSRMFINTFNFQITSKRFVYQEMSQ